MRHEVSPSKSETTVLLEVVPEGFPAYYVGESLLIGAWMLDTSLRVCVIGLGYVGLPTSLLLSKAGHQVHGFDVNPATVKSLNQGVATLKEPGLHEALQATRLNGNFVASESPTEADIFLIAVPTPVSKRKKADLRFVEAATASIVPYIKPGNLVIVESTVPPGCCQEVVATILRGSGLEAGKDYHLAHCPERVLPGNALYELAHNPRIIGGFSEECSAKAEAFYRSFVHGEIFTTGLYEAELAKLTENAYRDVNLAFVNTLAAICEQIDVDVERVIELANHHPRVNLLKPGPGVGGHCIPVDPWFLVQRFPAETLLLRTARAVNDERPHRIVEKVLNSLEQQEVSEPTVAALGVTYKANVCDVRESPALEIVELLKKKGINVRVCDPVANGRSPEPGVPLEEALQGADLVLGLVGHDCFKTLDLDKVEKLTGKRSTVVDACGLWALAPKKATAPLIQ